MMIDETGRTHAEIARDNAKADVFALEKMLGLPSPVTDRDLLKEAMKALKPFADEAQQYDQNDDDKIPDEKDTAWSSDFSVGEIRQARTTYDKLKAAFEPDKDKP